MIKVDYIIVGLGIGGLSLCEELEKNNKSYIVFDKGEITSTIVSAGVINPVVLKRFTPVWNAKLHIDSSILFYKQLTKKLKYPVFNEVSMLRIFKSIEEQNNWIVASDKKELALFLEPTILKNNNSAINAPFGFGKVNNTGRINPKDLINSYKKHLQEKGKIINEKFNYSEINNTEEGINYKNINSKKIIFCEGASAKNNPFFPQKTKISEEPLIIPNKGEYLIIEAKDLNLHSMLKTSLFIIPLGEDLYKIGATYDRDDHTLSITNNAKASMITKIEKIINCKFKVVDQIAGIRPTTRDRRPFLGVLNEFNNIVFFNGLGTRGITAAPSLANTLYNFLEYQKEIPKEMNIKRYYKW